MNTTSLTYVNKIITSTNGMKCLLLDANTIQFITCCYSLSSLLKNDVYLTCLLDSNRDSMKHLKCVVFLRATDSNVLSLVNELKNPFYQEYHLFFSSILKKSHLELLAEADSFLLVKQVHEYYFDYIVSSNNSIYLDRNFIDFTRSVDGIIALLLSQKKRPIVRFDKASIPARKLATEVVYQITLDPSLFEFRRPECSPLLLILDRRYFQINLDLIVSLLY